MTDIFVPKEAVIPYIYMITPLPLAANASGEVNINLADDSFFALTDFIASTSADSTATVPNNFTVRIRDETTGREFSNVPLPQAVVGNRIANTGLREQVFPVFPRLNTFNFQFLNLTGNTITINFGLKGYKVFNPEILNNYANFQYNA